MIDISLRRKQAVMLVGGAAGVTRADVAMMLGQ
jgi:hypothetical protein